MGLLSRTLTIRGTKQSDATSEGPHMRIEGAARLSGVLFERMGQTNVRSCVCLPCMCMRRALCPPLWNLNI